jgi:steroid delta-isomerase-like uncharacterized protein
MLEKQAFPLTIQNQVFHQSKFSNTMKTFKFFSLTLLLALAANTLFANNNYPAPSDVVKQYFAAVDAGNAAELQKLLADNFTATTPMSPQPMDKQTWAATMQAFKTAFPDMKHTVSSIESGFVVAVGGVFSGQNNGPLMGNPPTGNRVSCPFNAWLELDASWKIKSINSQFDMKAFESQLVAGLPNPALKAELDIRAMLAAADEGNGEKFMAYWLPDAPNYFAGKQTSGDDMKKRILGFKMGFPDIKRNLEEVIVSGKSVTVRGWVTGTNTGQFRGQAATGSAIKVPWLGLYKLNAAGKIEAGWVEFDTAMLDSQLKDNTQGSRKK